MSRKSRLSTPKPRISSPLLSTNSPHLPYYAKSSHKHSILRKSVALCLLSFMCGILIIPAVFCLVFFPTMDYFDAIVVDLFLERASPFDGAPVAPEYPGAPSISTDLMHVRDDNILAPSRAIPVSVLLSNLTDSFSLAHHQLFLRRFSADEEDLPPPHPVYYLREMPEVREEPTILNYSSLGLYALVKQRHWTMNWWLNKEAKVHVQFLPGGFTCERQESGDEEPSCLLSMAWIKGREKFEQFQAAEFTNVVEYAEEWTILDGDSEDLPAFELEATAGDDEYFLVFSFHGKTRMNVQHVLNAKVSLLLHMYEIKKENIYGLNYDVVPTPLFNANKEWKYVLIQDVPPEHDQQVEYKLSRSRVNMRFERSPRLMVGIPFVTVASLELLTVLLVLFLSHRKIWARMQCLSEYLLVGCRLTKRRRMSPDILYMGSMADDDSDEDDEASTPSTTMGAESTQSSILIRHSVPYDSRRVSPFHGAATHNPL